MQKNPHLPLHFSCGRCVALPVKLQPPVFLRSFPFMDTETKRFIKLTSDGIGGAVADIDAENTVIFPHLGNHRKQRRPSKAFFLVVLVNHKRVDLPGVGFFIIP